MAGHAGHRPSALSGGQAQRVALARALATDPRACSCSTSRSPRSTSAPAATVRRDLRRHLESFDGMRLLVTHDPVDAYALADRVVVLEAGRVVQSGTLAEVTAHPRSRYVADLVGAQPHRRHARRRHAGDHRRAARASPPAHLDDGPAYVAIRPQAVSLHRHHPEGSARNVWELTVEDVDQLHDRARVALAGVLPIVAEITPGALLELDLRPGDRIWASVKATDIIAYSA